jgi:hypothetical protein
MKKSKGVHYLKDQVTLMASSYEYGKSGVLARL